MLAKHTVWPLMHFNRVTTEDCILLCRSRDQIDQLDPASRVGRVGRVGRLDQRWSNHKEMI